MNDFQILYGFCVVFIASTLMIVAYFEANDSEIYFESDETHDDH